MHGEMCYYKHNPEFAVRERSLCLRFGNEFPLNDGTIDDYRLFSAADTAKFLGVSSKYYLY